MKPRTATRNRQRDQSVVGGPRRIQTLSLADATIRRLRRQSAKRGVSMSRHVDAMVLAEEERTLGGVNE